MPLSNAVLTILGIVGIGAIVASVVQSFSTAWVAGEQRRAERLERVATRAHELEQERREDERQLRDARLGRLRDDARELTQALFDLQRVMLYLQWGRDHRRPEREGLEQSARERYERARAGLALDPDGRRLEALFTKLSSEIAQYETMLESQRALVEARTGQQAIEHAAKLEEQRKLVLDEVDEAVREVGTVLADIERPVETGLATVERTL
jgi:hypothetical protein